MRSKDFISMMLILYFTGCQPSKNEYVLSDIRESPMTLTVFGENIISTPLYERDIAISPNFDEIVYTIGDFRQNRRCLVAIKKRNTHWTKPEILNISGKYQDIEPFFNSDGNRLYFASDRPIYDDNTRSDYNIWYCDKNEGLWSEPIPLDSMINTKQDEFFPSLGKSGNLYFTSMRESGFGREDIFISELKEGKYQLPRPLPSEINTTFYEFNAFISPDEDYIIFSSFGREDDMGGGDLYISEKDKDGKWEKARNLGEKINSRMLDYCPFVDSESHNLYFTSDRTSVNNDSLKTISDIMKIANSINNGFGNIYYIDFNDLNVGHP